MKKAPNAWAFFDDEEERGIRLDPSGRIELCDEAASIRQSILLILSTMPGERVMRPDWGCELNKILFQPNDFLTAGLAQFYIERALTRWEPRIDLRQVEVDADAYYPERLNIQLSYEIKNNFLTDEVRFSVDLSGRSPHAD